MPEQMDPEIMEQTFAMLVAITQAANDSDANKLFDIVVKSIYHNANQEIATALSENSGTILMLLRNIDPEDVCEQVYIATFAVGYMLGVYKLTQKNKADRTIGLRLLESACMAMLQFCKKQRNTKENKRSSRCIQ